MEGTMFEAMSLCDTKNKLTKYFGSRYFQPLLESGCQHPGISLASEIFSSLYFTKK